METVIENNQYDFQPEAGRSYHIGWKVMGAYFVELLVIGIIYVILTGPVGGFQWKMDDLDFEWFMIPLALFGMAYGIIIGFGVLPVIIYSVIVSLKHPSEKQLFKVSHMLKIAMPVGIIGVLAGFQGW